MAVPEPANVSPWYLRNITQALALDESTGNVYIRTDADISIGNANITVGNVGINSLGNVDISGNTLPVTIDNANIEVTQGTSPWIVEGNVVATLSGNLAGITGNVTVVDGGGSLTVDGNVGITGNVNICTMPEVEIKNDTGNPIPVSKDTNTNSVTNPIYVEGVNNASFFAPTQSDAFGRLRVSNPLTLFDTQARYFDHQQFSSNTAVGGSVTYNANSSTFALSVSGNGSTVQRETTKTFIYQPGKSLFILNTFAMNTPTAGLTQSVGYYNDENGIFFEADGTTLNMVIRSTSSGATVETAISQSNWNGDTLLGTGGSSNPSGIELNPALTQIFWCDIEWLGVGSVRCGFVIGGQYIVCHTFNHANIPGNTTTYMTTACLPVRYEISSTGPIGTMTQICSTVISEGGYSLTGLPRGIGHSLGSPTRLANDPAIFTPLISIRLKSTNLDAIVLPTNYTIAAVANSIYKYRVYKKAVTSGGTWVSAGSDSSVEYNLAPTAIVSGSVTEEAFIISSNQSSQAPSQLAFAFEEQLQRDSFSGVAYEYVLTAATTGTNQDLYASVEWQEIS